MEQTIGKRIKELRQKLNMSADDLAEAIGKDRATIYRWEGGYIEKLPINILNPLSKILRTTPAYLMGWENDNQGINNGIIGNFNNNNQIVNAPQLTPIVNSIVAICSVLPEDKQSQVLTYATKLLSEK